MTKPYNMDELLARCQAILRRTAANDAECPGEIKILSLKLDTLRQRACINERDMNLTPKEFSLLLFLATHPGERFTGAELYSRVWGLPVNDDIRTVKAHIYNLRRKLKTDTEFAITRPDRKHYLWTVL